MVAWESLLERDAIILFEFSPGVVAYQEQPSIEVYYEDTVPRRYFPDFALHLQDGSVAHVEVKPASKLRDAATKDRYSRIAQQYERQARQFRILTEEDIRAEPRLSNLKLLAYHKREPQSHLQLDVLLGSLRHEGSRTLENFAELLGGVEHVYHLLAAGLLTCDLTLPIQRDTTIHPVCEGAGSDSLFF
jgi:hypothetical protein